MTNTATAEAMKDLEQPGAYANSGQKVGYDTYSWGQPPAAHFVFVASGCAIIGTEKGTYVSSSAGYAQESDLELNDELSAWQMLRNEAFRSLGPDF
jgi:hypothetical protein